MRPKVITHSILLGERGVTLVAGRVMEMGFVWYPTGSVESGIDGHVELRDAETGQVFNAVFGLQSKAVGRAFANETPTSFDYYCDERDLAYWLMGNLPVVLVVSRPSTDEAYWVSIKDYFADPTRRAARKVHFDKRADRFDLACRDALFRLAAPRNAGMYLAPPRIRERLLSNLLPVAVLPARLYVADTQHRDGQQLWRAARSAGADIGGEWILRNKWILSFRNLRRPEWAGLCDQGTVEDFAVAEWSATDDAAARRDFVDLLRRTLREMVRADLGYHEQRELFYFRATADLTSRKVAYRGLTRPTERTVFEAYPGEQGTIKYYRHSAFHDRFRRFDGRWYLEITPTYHFTSDGYRMRQGHFRFLKGIKAIEGHEAVRGQVIMWAAFLTPRPDMFTPELYPFLGFGELASFEADRGVDETLWGTEKERSHPQEQEPADAASDGAGQQRLAGL